MSGKKRVGQSDCFLFFSTQTNEMHILAVIMLHRHKFCVYKGKRKLKLPITCENIVLFALYQFLFWFVNIVLENVEKSLQSGFLERVDRVTENTAFFPA